MSIATTAYVAEVGSFFERGDLSYLEAPLRRASRKLRRWVGATAYDTAESAGAGEVFDALRETEALLAVREALPSVNRADTGKGITLTSGINSTEGSKTTRYMNPAEVSAEQQRLIAQALEQVRDYLLSAYQAGLKPAHIDESDFQDEEEE